MISDHTLETLEYPKLIDLIAGRCLTPYGRELVSAFSPGSDIEAIRQRHRESREMLSLVAVGAPLPLSRVDDVRELIDDAGVQGVRLGTTDFVRLRDHLQVFADVAAYDRAGRENIPNLGRYFDEIRTMADLRRAIDTAIDDRGEIRDSASSELRRIRRELYDGRRRLVSKLERMLAGSKSGGGQLDDVVTQRNGRYVIPILANAYRSESGILHDRSQTGATLFVEPVEPVEAIDGNNRLQMLARQEEEEIFRILQSLTTAVGDRREEFAANLAHLAVLDSHHAVAQCFDRWSVAVPRMSEEPGVRLQQARHPLLVHQMGGIENVVPLDIALHADQCAIVITGPNTGGKTIALKTVGLLVLMAQSGLPVPAAEQSEIGIYESVFADIGDEQSLELSLSTFSAHLRNVVQATEHATDRSLVLLDEIGAGTDPMEGAGLAESLVRYFVERGANLIVTTHYSQLKTLALDLPGVVNASLAFDKETLAPTYFFQLGVPGSSYAVDVARRLGMPRSVCDAASALIGTGERDVANLIDALQTDLAAIRTDQEKLRERLAKAEQLERYYKLQTEKLDKEVDAARKEALAETEELLDSARRETERLVAEIRKSQASPDSVRELHRTVKATKDKVEKQRQKNTPSKPEPAVDRNRFRPGDAVRIVDWDKTGELLELVGHDRARITVGAVTTVVSLRQLEKVVTAKEVKRHPVQHVRRGSQPMEPEFSPEIHLRGQTVEEAIASLEKHIDRALVARFPQIYVVHGKGTGTLRRVLTEWLKKRSEIESVRLADWNEGGLGVTVAKLKI